MEPPRPRGVPWGPQLVSELQNFIIRINELNYSGLAPQLCRIGQGSV